MINHSVILTNIPHWCVFFNQNIYFSTRNELCFSPYNPPTLHPLKPFSTTIHFTH